MGNACTSKKPQLKNKKRLSAGCSMVQASSLAQPCDKDIQQDNCLSPHNTGKHIFQEPRPTADTTFTDVLVCQLERSPQPEPLELPTSKLNSLSTCGSKISGLHSQTVTKITTSEKPYNLRKRTNSQRANQLENFLISRKQYMQERGYLSYTAATVLPPPILKNPNASSLKQKRKVQTLSTLKDISMRGIQDVKKFSMPTQMHTGDLDHIVIEI